VYLCKYSPIIVCVIACIVVGSVDPWADGPATGPLTAAGLSMALPMDDKD
jgi:hypothetical protein